MPSDWVPIASTVSGAVVALAGALVARTETVGPDRSAAVSRAMQESALYSVRERLLMSGTIEIVQAGEDVLRQLVAIRNAVRAGATLSTPEFHAVYHPYAEALWTFRVAVRRELGQDFLVPDVLGRTSWSEQEECPRCQQPRAASV